MNRDRLRQASAAQIPDKALDSLPKPKRALLLLFVISFLIRICYWAEIRHNLLFLNPILDSAWYDQWAQEISRGDWLSRSKGLLSLSPGYAYWLASQYLTIGRSMELNALLQMMIASAIPVLIFLIAARLFVSRMFAFAAGLAYAGYGPAVCYSAMPITATWIDFLNIASLWIIMRAHETRSPLLFGVAGTAIGVSSLFRPNVLLLAVFVIALIVFRSVREQRGAAIRSAAALALGLAFPVAAFAARNYVVTREFTCTAKTGSMNFFIGNHKWATGKYVRLDDIESGNPFTQLEDYRAFASREVGRPLNMKESNRFWRDKALNDIARDPARWLGVEAKKLLFLASGYELGGNVSYYYFVESSRLLSALSIVVFSDYAVLALVGMVLIGFSAVRIDRFSAEVTGLYAATYVISSLIFFVLAEYRFALVCPAVIFASYTLLEIKRFFDERNWKKFIPTAGAVIVAISTIRMADAQHFGGNLSQEVAVSVTAEGNALVQKGRIDEAADVYRRAIGISPSGGAAYINLVRIYISQGRCVEAIPILEEALRSARAHQLFELMGECKIKISDYRGAVQHLENAYKLRPTNLNKKRLEYAIQKAR